jgi:hypothetical protein
MRESEEDNDFAEERVRPREQSKIEAERTEYSGKGTRVPNLYIRNIKS